ncbi:MAG: nucleotidyltransferase domain-containing protein [Archaeoglobaceae archaeon]|nr:nucleotidyltransferase domain-containing protein [Archaeoglobaceae archaeon]
MKGIEVVYNEEKWRILRSKREKARTLMEKLAKYNIVSVLYGSIARGDVSVKSDIDIFVVHLIPSFRIEIALGDFDFVEKRIVQATPNYAIKGELVIDEETIVSFPLVRMKEREMDFYRFGGCISYEELLKGLRVPGVDKRLMLIIPIKNGHKEVAISEIHPSSVAKILKISVDTVIERMRVLGRRREIGRTGIYLCEKIPVNESFESALMEIAFRDPAVKRRMES